MGHGRACTAFAASRFHHDHRLEARGHPQPAEERAGIGDALDIQQYAPGLGVHGEKIQEFAETDVRRRAEGGHCREPETLGGAPVQQGGAKRAGLGDQRHPAGGHAAFGKARVEANARPDHPQAVGAHQGYVVGACDIEHFRLQGESAVTDLPEAGRYDDDRAHTLFTALVHHRRDRRGRDGDDYEVYRAVDILYGRIGFQTLHTVVFRVHRIDIPGKPAFDEVAQYLASDGRLPVRCPHHDDGLRLENFLEVVFSHGSSSPGLGEGIFR